MDTPIRQTAVRCIAPIAARHCTARHLPILLLLTLLASAQAQDFTWTTNNDTITITGYTGPGGSVTIPSTITDLPVVNIGTNAFYTNTVITDVVIPDGVTNIGGYAFAGCPILTNVMIGNSATNIGWHAAAAISPGLRPRRPSPRAIIYRPLGLLL